MYLFPTVTEVDQDAMNVASLIQRVDKVKAIPLPLYWRGVCAFDF